MRPRVPPMVAPSNLTDWGRKVATSLNLTIGDVQDKQALNDNLTSLSGLTLTGSSGYAIVVNGSEDGFELSAAGGGGVTTNVLTINNGGAGAASGATFDGSAPITISYNTVGAAASGHDHDSDYLALSGGTLTGDLSVPDEAYGSGWNASVEVPTKNAVYDKIETIGTAGRLIGRQTFTSGSGTYTPTAGTGSVIIEMVGGGGGGSGISSPGASNGSKAASGGGAVYVRKRLTANFSGGSYSVGAGGAGGASGANSGAAGNSSTFTDTAATVYTAAGGVAGGFSAGTSTFPILGAFAAGRSGSGSNGDFTIPGGASGLTTGWTTTQINSGQGGASHFSPGADPVRIVGANTSDTGNNALGYGGGGSAACGVGTGVARAGGNGSDGLIIIWEYS